MDLNDYQRIAGSTAIYPDRGRKSATAINYTILGLTGEAGEIANAWKKGVRDGDGALAREKLRFEIGDVLWYVAQLAAELGMELEDVAKANIEKLQDRKTRNVIRGSGDKR